MPSVDPENPAAVLPLSQEQQPLLLRTNNAASPDEKRSSSSSSSEDSSSTILDDIYDTIQLGLPIFMAMLSWVGMKTTDSALLGHVSADALAAAALSDLWTMVTGVLIQARVLSVLCGAAIGAGKYSLSLSLQKTFNVWLVVVLPFVHSSYHTLPLPQEIRNWLEFIYKSRISSLLLFVSLSFWLGI